MEESLKNRALGIFEKDQKQLEGAFDTSSDVRAVGIVSSTTITEKDDGTYEKTVKEENAEDLYYDDTVVGKVENEIKEELSEFEKRLAIDYQLQRAIDLIRGVSLYRETLE